MSAHPHTLRSKLSSTSAPLKSTPTNSPFSKAGIRSPRKATNSSATLSLQHVIGTTTSGPHGFSCHAPSNTYAYCAGSTAVLAKVDADGQVSQKFYKARPTVSSVNPHVSFYEHSTPTGTNRGRRKSVVPTRLDGNGATPSGSPFREWGDEATSQTWTARERIKAASSVSISPDGRLLAVGETGYNPRVLIFSTAEDAIPNIPLSITSEHSFGVRAVAFSPDSRYLATLGDVNDGFLFIWLVNPKNGSIRLHSANRCTTNLCDMVWCGTALITVGTRHIKVWRVAELNKPSPSKRARLKSEDGGIASPAPQTLSGRNTLLGNLVDETFTCAVAVSGHEAIICTEGGHICLLDDLDSRQELKFIKRMSTRISSITFSSHDSRVLLGDRRGTVHSEPVNGLICEATGCKSSPAIPSTPVVIVDNHGGNLPSISSRSKSLGKSRSIIAVGALACSVVSVDSECSIEILQITDSENRSWSHHSSHSSAVKGLQALDKDGEGGAFFTWSGKGQIRFWTSNGRCTSSKKVELEQVSTEDEDCSNELKVVRRIHALDLFVSGDQFGVLKIITGKDWTLNKEVRAHAAEISDIAPHPVDNNLLATCGRDRVVQLFRVSQNDVEIVQTLDEHIGAVTQVLFSASGEKLFSASADRTIIIRDQITREVDGNTVTAYLCSKIVTLKATPTSMSLVPEDADHLVVSTMDRHILKLSISTGSVAEAFKVSDPENDDTAILSSLCISKSRLDGAPRLLVGFSATDKSIRVYDLDRDVLLSRESGHTEGISDIVLREEVDMERSSVRRNIVSTGLDGTIMIWNFALAPPQPILTPLQELSEGQAVLAFDSEGTPVKPSPASLPPLRKVLTNLDIAQYTAVDSVTGSPKQVSLRTSSPSRLGRRPSRLMLAHSSIDEDEVVNTPAPTSPTFLDTRYRGCRSSADSPSPPPSSRLLKQRSRPELRSRRTTSNCRSPSPSNISLPTSTPVTPQQKRGKNGKLLRRPPSMPTDMRGLAMQASRRQSVGNLTGAAVSTSEFGSLAMAGEQACRMLRTYRKKLGSSHDPGVELGEVMSELTKTLKAVSDKMETSKVGDKAQVRTAKAIETDVSERANEVDDDRDLESLRVLLEQANLAGDALQNMNGITTTRISR